MMTAQAGHNSAAFGEELRDDIETVLGDDHETVFHYAQWHIGDYVAGTRGMSLEHEGAYIRFLMRLYERGKPLPDDDRFMATCMALSIRVWRRIKQTLIQFGKIVCRNGCLTNARFERERQRRAAEIKKQAHAARKGWDRKRSEEAKKAETSPKVPESLDEVWSKVLKNFTEKCSKINDRGDAPRARTNNQYPIIPPIVPPKKGGTRRGRKKLPNTKLPDDWILPDEWRQWARDEHRLTDFQIDQLAKRFHRYWTSADAKNGGYKKDWKLTWKNSVDGAVDNGRVPKANGYVNGHNPGDTSQLPEAVRRRMEAEKQRKNGSLL